MNFLHSGIVTATLISSALVNTEVKATNNDVITSNTGFHYLTVEVRPTNSSADAHRTCNPMGSAISYSANKIDLNSDAGGHYQYLCGTKESISNYHNLVTGIGFVINGNAKSDSEIINECASYYGGNFWTVTNGRVDMNGNDTGQLDLNRGVGGEYIYMCIQNDPNKPPIKRISIAARGNRNTAINECKSNGTPYAVKATNSLIADLNAGAGGAWIPVCTDVNINPSVITPPPGDRECGDDLQQCP